MFKKINLFYRKWKHSDFLKWRYDLNEYEKNFLLPELKGRVDELLKSFKKIDDYCTTRVDEKSFGSFLRPLILEKKIEHLVPPELRPPSDEILARKFFEDFKKMNNESFIQPLEKILKIYDTEIDLKKFGELLNEINRVCSTVIQIKEDLFFYSFNSYAAVFNTNTNEVVVSEPKELKLILLPFQVIIKNIYGVANSTSGTIHNWHKEQMEWKTAYLKVLSEKIARRNNLLAIIVAITISWLFLTLSSPYDKLRLEFHFDKLKANVTDLTLDNDSLRSKNIMFEKQIDQLQIDLNQKQNQLDETLKRIKNDK